MGSLGRGMELLPSIEGWPHTCLVLAPPQDAVRVEDFQIGNRIKKIGLHKTTLACAQHRGAHACGLYLRVLRRGNARFSLPFSLGKKCLKGTRPVTRRQPGRFLVVHRSSYRAEMSL